MNKGDRARELIMDQLLMPFFQKKEQKIGVEFEMPVFYEKDVRNQKGAKECVCDMLDMLISKHGFTEKTRGSDGCLVKVSKDGDTVSADYYYRQIEFAMKESGNLCQIEQRLHMYFPVIQEFLKSRGFFLSGVGTNPFFEAKDAQLTMDAYCRAYHTYMERYTSYEDASCFLTNMSSIQTHLDVTGEELLSMYNWLNRTNFVSGLLFSNSLPAPGSLPEKIEIPQRTCWCFRDILWRKSEFPNTGCVNKQFHSLEELADWIAGLKIYIKHKDESYTSMEPVSLEKYFAGNTEDFSDVSFRSFENIAISSYGTIEIRSDCMQPLKELFAPSAFYLGLAQNLSRAQEITEVFFQENHIDKKNEELRMLAVTDGYICQEEALWTYVDELYRLAENGLKERGFGEESYISCLKERIAARACPAKKMAQRLCQGETPDQMIKAYAQW